MTRSKKTILRMALAALCLWGTLATAHGEQPSVTVLGTLTGELRAPGKLALDAGGNLYVADVQNRGIVKYDASAHYRGLVKVSGVVRSVALAADGRLLVSHDNRVTLYALDGAETGDLAGYSFAQPNGITLDADGNIYVADSKANKIAVFTKSGSFISAFGSAGKKQGQFNFPTALAYEKASNLIAVADTLNDRVQFFGTDGVFKRAIGTPTSLSGPLSFAYPNGIAFDYTSGVRMYVSDGFQGSLQVVDLGTPATFVGYLGSYGQEEGQFIQLSDVLFDQQHARLIAADTTGMVTFFAVGGNEQANNTTLTGLNAPGNVNVAGSGTVAGGNAATASTGTTGAASSGAGEGGRSAVSAWQYPSGIDCRHAKAGSILCR